MKPVLIDEYEYHCGNCNNNFEITLEDIDCGVILDKYCGQCGVKIDWGE